MRGGIDMKKKVAVTDVVELYGNPFCPCSNKVQLCLFEKHVSYKYVFVDLIETGDWGNLSRTYLKVNPAGVVPTLVHEGRPVYESRDVLDYVDAAMHGRSLSPKAVGAHCAARCDRCVISGTADFSARSCERSLGACAMVLSVPLVAALAQDVNANRIRKGLLLGRRQWPLLLLSLKRWGKRFIRKMPNLMTGLRTAIHHAKHHLDALEADLVDGRPWVCGADYTLADVSLMAILDRLDDVHDA